MEETLRRETRIRAFPRHALIERKMLEAKINISVLRGGAPSVFWLSLLVKFSSPVIFAIVVDCSEN